LSVPGHLRAPGVCVAAIVAMQCFTAPAVAQNPRVIADSAGDALIRRTDLNNDAPFDLEEQRLPDVVEMRIGKFTPALPHVDRFTGNWAADGQYMRFDTLFDGLINPPGPVNLDDDWPIYAPLYFGPNPVYGFIELDMDADESTGGELEYPDYRYLGHVARFGGMPPGAEFANRVAVDRTAFNSNIQSPPYCERSGEEFHLAFDGEGDEIENIVILVERPGGDPDIFEAGERWVLTGDFLHRAHGFEDFAFQCEDRPGRYEPEVRLQFQHDETNDVTTVTLVFPLTNAAAAKLQSPNATAQPNDGCEDNQTSVTEALTDLRWSAINASPSDQNDPEFQLIAGWADNTVANHLDPTQWRITCLLGSAYPVQPGSQERYVFTDIWPNVIPGDFNGDGSVDAVDTALCQDYVGAFDGDSSVDSDGENGVIAIEDFARSAILFDVNFDGFVDENDSTPVPVLGDMDLNGVVEFNDVDDFVLALLDSVGYTDTHGGQDPLTRGDITQDGLLNGVDLSEFVSLLTTWP